MMLLPSELFLRAWDPEWCRPTFLFLSFFQLFWCAVSHQPDVYSLYIVWAARRSRGGVLEHMPTGICRLPLTCLVSLALI